MTETTKKEALARRLCASFRNCTEEDVDHDVANCGDDFMNIWRRLAAVALEEQDREVKKIDERFQRVRKALSHLLAEKTGYYFICGEGGAHDEMGLPEVILVCPTYGLDGACAYRKDGEYTAPGW